MFLPMITGTTVACGTHFDFLLHILCIESPTVLHFLYAIFHDKGGKIRFLYPLKRGIYLWVLPVSQITS